MYDPTYKKPKVNATTDNNKLVRKTTKASKDFDAKPPKFKIPKSVTELVYEQSRYFDGESPKIIMLPTKKILF